MHKSVARNAAWWVSMILNPLIVPPIIFAIVARSLGFSNWNVGVVFLTAVLLYCVAPLAYLLVLLKFKAIDSIEARDQSKRQSPLYWGALWLAFAIPIMMWVSNGVSPVFGLTSAIFAFNTFLIAAINRSFKISIHVSGVSGFLSILIALHLWQPVGPELLSIPLVLGSIASIILVCWARFTSKAHQLAEIGWGIVFGLVAPVLEITLAALIWKG